MSSSYFTAQTYWKNRTYLNTCHLSDPGSDHSQNHAVGSHGIPFSIVLFGWGMCQGKEPMHFQKFVS